MRLVGASNLFIQLPFVLEGVLAAALGSVLAGVVLGVGVHFGVSGWLQSRMAGVNLVTVGDVAVVTPILIAVGVVMAGASSWLTLRRYMKV